MRIRIKSFSFVLSFWLTQEFNDKLHFHLNTKITNFEVTSSNSQINGKATREFTNEYFLFLIKPIHCAIQRKEKVSLNL